MYSTCLFCHASLEKNDAIEHFPIGRRLAYDAAKGRLWVVCRKCTRWNLTPIEERWEAIEECERAFSSTRMRVSTDNVGLARLPEGLELVRIGKPLRPEFAAWRYGDDFGRRHRRYMAYSAGVGVVALGKYIAGPLLGFAAITGTFSGVYAAWMAFTLIQQNRVRGRVIVPGETRPALVRTSRLEAIRIVSIDDSWRILMPLDAAALTGGGKREVVIEGDAALRAAATILSVANTAGGNKDLVRQAVDVVTERPDASSLFVHATRGSWTEMREESFWKYRDWAPKSRPGAAVITDIPAEIRLAMEMATNEDIERRAMEGEIAMLEAAWKQAEEIAAIADNLDLAKPDDISARSDT